MAVVLSSEDNDIFSSSSLRRSHSQQYLPKQPQDFRSSASTSRINDYFRHEDYRHPPLPPDSSPSLAPSSPSALHSDSYDPSYISTPATSISLDGACEENIHDEPEDSIVFSEFNRNSFFGPIEDLEPPPSPRTGDSYTISPTDQDTPVTISRSESPTYREHADDDTAVQHHPTQHVDYLSHSWKEEDIWSSWRYIVARRGEVNNGPRLENASWRTWMKAKYNLRTVSPDTLNWLKDCDVTWLYGPLQTRQSNLFPGSNGEGSLTLSRSNSFVNKKPILKKRSLSEIMLQRSLSSSSLLKQATAVLQAQQQEGGARGGRPALQRAATDCVAYPFSYRRRSQENTSLLPSAMHSGVTSPSVERKHIHFDEQVKQCIALEIKGEDDDEDELDNHHWRLGDDSDPDDGAIMMKKTRSRKRPILPRRRSPVNTNQESKTIAMLPSTKLKYRQDSPEPETAMKHSATYGRNSILSPSSSQETLRPSKSSGPFLLGDDDVQDTEAQNTSLSLLSSSVEATRYPKQPIERSASTNSLTQEPAGMRRTESGMFMPYEDNNSQHNDGIIGRVIDTVNTAKDIAHVIWNVGWKR